MKREPKSIQIDPRLYAAIKSVAKRQKMTVLDTVEAAMVGLLPPGVTAQIREEFGSLCEQDRKTP